MRDQTGWDVRFVDDLSETPSPSTEELEVLRDLERRTSEAHRS